VRAPTNTRDEAHATSISRARRGPRLYGVEIVESGRMGHYNRSRPHMALGPQCARPAFEIRWANQCEIGESNSILWMTQSGPSVWTWIMPLLAGTAVYFAFAEKSEIRESHIIGWEELLEVAPAHNAYASLPGVCIVSAENVICPRANGQSSFISCTQHAHLDSSERPNSSRNKCASPRRSLGRCVGDSARPRSCNCVYPDECLLNVAYARCWTPPLTP
jgi:hypothetical protein